MNGSLAEWLGTGLQNRLRRFESAKYLVFLQKKKDAQQQLDVLFCLSDSFLGTK